MYQPVTIADLQSHFTYVPWLTYINNIFGPNKVFKPQDKIIVSGLKYFHFLGEILENTDNRVIANYMGWRMVLSSLSSLGKKFRAAHDELNKAILGTESNSKNWLVCLSHASLKFPLAMGALYVRKYFDTSKKEKMENIIREMQNSFKAILGQVSFTLS